MKVFKYIISSLALVVAMVSCNDEFNSGNQGSATDSDTFGEYEMPFYLGIKLDTNAPGSRAGASGDGFLNGSSTEYALAPASETEDYHYVWIYNSSFDGSDGSYPGATLLTLDSRNTIQENPEVSPHVTIGIKNVYTYRQIYEQINSKATLTRFLDGATVLVLLNFDKSRISNLSELDITRKSDESLAQLSTKEILGRLTPDGMKKIILNDYKITARRGTADVEYFTMSSAVYHDGSGISVASKINRDEKGIYVYYTYEEALAAEHPTINAYVDRLAGKVDLVDKNGTQIKLNDVFSEGGNLNVKSKVKVFNKLNDDYTYDYDEKGWTATVAGYGLNGLESGEYLFKSIENTDFYKNLSDATKYRTYWARDPHYYIRGNTGEGDDQHYPQQYRTALENSSIRAHSDDATLRGDNIEYKVKASDFLKYVSYSDIQGKTGLLYAMENTYDDSDENDNLGLRGYFSASTHLLMACRMTLDGVTAGTNLYRDQNEIFFTSETQILGAKLSIMQNKFLPGGNSGLRVYNANWLEERPYTADFVTVSWNPGDRLMILEKFADGSKELRELRARELTLIPAELAGGDGQMLIAPLNSDDFEYYICSPDATVADLADKIPLNYNRLVSLFYALLGPVDYFNQGCMYYATPIPHSVDSFGALESKVTGHVGLVRNHWYTIKVSGIEAPGIPVAAVRQPIVPYLDVKRSYLNVSAEIIDWHTVQQDVDHVFDIN